MRIMVGLSGGVDSAVSTALLKRAGAEVVGAYIKTWMPEWLANKCDWREERHDAMRVASALDIPFVTVDLEKEYKKGVVDYMIADYKAGRTPNPDVMCNKEVKFGAFLKRALEMGADAVATGHYAQTKVLGSRYQLLAGDDTRKDQSYFLWTLTQEQLARTIFPIGHLIKSEVRELARKFKLPVAGKRDSQGICFLGHIDMKEFLSHYIESKRGDVLNEQGSKMGEHDGAVLYTLGQAWQKPYYVVAKDIEKNTITVSMRKSEDTYSTWSGRKCITLREVNWIAGVEPKKLTSNTYNLSAQIRYHGEVLRCTVQSSTLNSLEIMFAEPVLVATGQSVVFYKNDICLGGGIVV